MRILFVSNFYPPARPGGYTQWCHEVAEGLKERGHTIGILTSRYEREKAFPEEENVYRLLHLNGDLLYYQPRHFFTRWEQEQKENLEIITRVTQEFQPDLVFVWGMWAMAKQVPAKIESLYPKQTVYYLSDYWPMAEDMHSSYWNMPPNRSSMRPFKDLLRLAAMSKLARWPKPNLQFRNAITVSEAVRDILIESGQPFQNAIVIHGGTKVNRFTEIRERRYEGPLKMLYAGQLVSHKGVHTAVEAIDILVNQDGIRNLSLEVAGVGPPYYEDRLRQMVQDASLDAYITFHGLLPKTKMPELMEAADVLIFPSVYEEPFARMTQEAMLAGLVVVGTTTGGTKEILFENETGLTFPAENAEALARQLHRLIKDPAFCRRLSEAGRRSVLENYTLDLMVDQIEAFLEAVWATARTPNLASSYH